MGKEGIIAAMRVDCETRKNRSGFTLIELLVVIALIAILSSMIAPALKSAQDKAKTISCANNARQLLLATQLYEEDNKSFPICWFPPNGIWYRQLQPFLGREATQAGQGVFVCPASLQKRSPSGALEPGGFWGFLSYAMNGRINVGKTGMNMQNVVQPAGTIIYADTDGWDSCLYSDTDASGNVLYRHSGGSEWSTKTKRLTVRRPSKIPFGKANAGFLDGHVELIRKAPRQLFTLEKD